MMDQYDNAPPLIDNLEAAVAHAREVRTTWRRRSNMTDPARRKALGRATDRLRGAQDDLRPAIGSLLYHPAPVALEKRLRHASDLAQRERRALRKMVRSTEAAIRRSQ